MFYSECFFSEQRPKIASIWDAKTCKFICEDYLSTLTQKGQATIPADVRHKLRLHAGDSIGFEDVEGKIYIVKIQPFDYEYHKALGKTLSEWSSAEDDEADKDL